MDHHRRIATARLAEFANPRWPRNIGADIAAMMPGYYANGQAALEVDGN